MDLAGDDCLNLTMGFIRGKEYFVLSGAPQRTEVKPEKMHVRHPQLDLGHLRDSLEKQFSQLVARSRATAGGCGGISQTL